MPFTVTQTNSRLELRDKFFGDITGLSNFQVTLNGDSRAFGTFDSDPFNLTSGIVLSTGRVPDLVGANTEDSGLTFSEEDLSTDFGALNSDDDSITLQIDFDSDGSKDKIYFQYVFGSEEFLEFAGQKFNDSFSLSLNGQNLAILPGDGVDPNGNREVSINNLAGSPVGPFAKDPRYVGQDFLQYNSAKEGAVRDQTRLDGYTLPFTFEGALNNGSNTLTINIKDVSDGFYDSVVLLKADTFGTTRPADIIIPGLTLTAPNAAPIAVDVTTNVRQTTNLTGLSATDPDGTISSYAILTLPDPNQGTLFFGNPSANGTPIVAGQPLPPTLIDQLFFQPSSSFTGGSFTYTATDDKGTADPTPATVTLIGSTNPANPVNPTNPTDPSQHDRSNGCKPGKQIKGNKQRNRLKGTPDSDTIFGLGGNDKLRGLGCNDLLDGGRGNDRIFGGSGNDILKGRQDDDRMYGDDGSDRLNGGLGRDQLFGGNGNDILVGRRADDQLVGNAGNDTLDGGGNSDTLKGGVGDDRLYGWGQDDRLQGGSGNDRLNGGLGRDQLFGSNGNDTLFGRRGVDRLIGGLGSDRFMFNGNRPFDVTFGVDQIEFRSTDRDKIILSKKVFTALASNISNGFNLSSEFTVVRNNALAASSQASIVYSTSSRKLFYNANGTVTGFGQGSAFAKLLEPQNISQIDFVIQA
jgi:Ca2+-binding RTX toxin-like protein